MVFAVLLPIQIASFYHLVVLFGSLSMILALSHQIRLDLWSDHRETATQKCSKPNTGVAKI